MSKTLIGLATVLALCGSVPAALASGRDVIDDCTEDEIMSKAYTQKEYRDALAKLPADADQYGNCRDIIARAQESAATKGGSKKANSPTGTTTTPSGAATQPPAGPSVEPAGDQLAAASADDRAAVEDATKNVPTDAVGAGNPVDPDAVGVKTRAGAADLPVPVIILLALLLAGALAVGAGRLRSVVRPRRR